MIRTKLAVVTLAASLTIGFSGMAQSYMVDSQGSPADVRPGSSVDGSVTNIDPVNNAVQIKENNGMIQTVVMDQNVQVTKNGQATTIHDLDIGDLVTIKILDPNSNS